VAADVVFPRRSTVLADNFGGDKSGFFCIFWLPQKNWHYLRRHFKTCVNIVVRAPVVRFYFLLGGIDVLDMGRGSLIVICGGDRALFGDNGIVLFSFL